jgi:hypothetical protein
MVTRQLSPPDVSAQSPARSDMDRLRALSADTGAAAGPGVGAIAT